MGNETTELTVLSDDTGYSYDLMKLPDRSSPLIKEASQEILQEMQIDSIIQNLENVARLMFVAYNSLSGTMVQSKMSGMQKKYLDLMDESGQAITTFKQKSQEICSKVAKAYGWLIKGKEQMAVGQFNSCAAAAAIMAEKAEKLAQGFQKLGDQAETVLESTQDEQALQYKKIDELRADMEKYDAKLKGCESLRESLNQDIESINKIYNDAKAKEKDAFDMKKGLMITEIVTSCIGAIIPSVSSVKNGASAGDSKGVEAARSSLDTQEKEKSKLDKDKDSKQKTVDTLKAEKDKLEKEKKEILKKIEVERSITAHSEEEKAAKLEEYNKELEKNTGDLESLSKELEAAETELNSLDERIETITSSISKLNQQLEAFADQCRDDLARAEAAAEKALETKLQLEKQRRETLASIEEFTALIQVNVDQKEVAETAVQTLQVAIRCIKQVVVALTTAAKFWRSMEAYCQTLSDAGLGKEIQELSQGLTQEERLEYYRDRDFMMTFLIYVCRWAALFYVCDDYKQRNDKVRGMVEDNILASHTREEEWKIAGDLAQDMGKSIRDQVENSKKISAALKG